MQPLEAAVFATMYPNLNLNSKSIFPTRFQWCMCLPFCKIMKLLYSLIGLLVIASCDNTVSPVDDSQKIPQVESTTDNNITIIGEFHVAALDTHKFSYAINESKMIRFRSDVIEYIGGPDDGGYRGIYVSRENDGWGFGGYDDAGALVSPCDDEISIFKIHNHSHETRKITIYLNDE